MLRDGRWHRLRDDDAGFSLVELLTAMLLSGVVLTAMLTVFTTGLTNIGRANDRVEGTQRARAAVDRVTTLLNAQVCLDKTVSGAVTLVPPITAGDANSVTFYGDLKGASDTPDRYTLKYDPAARTLTEQKVVGSGAMPNATYTSAPTGKRVTEKLYPGRVGSTAQPIFQYYAFDPATGAVKDTPLAVPLTAATAPTVAKVVVQLAGAGDHSNQPDTRATTVMGEAIPLTADPTIDPTDSSSTPTVCPKS